MKRQSLLLVSFTMLLAAGASAQVQISKQIQMTGTTTFDKRITGLGSVEDTTDAVNAGSIQKSTLTYAAATGLPGAYAVFLPIGPATYTAGLTVTFKANVANAGPSTLNVNGLGTRPIFKNGNTQLAANDISANQVVTVVCDGSNFQIVGQIGLLNGFNGALSGDVSGTQNATVIGNSTINSARLVDQAVITSKIADSAVITSKLGTGAVTTTKLADLSVSTSKLVDQSVTTPKIADGSVTTGKLVPQGVTTAILADGSVNTNKLANQAVTNAIIADGSVSTGKIANQAVTTAVLADASVATAKLIDQAVTTPKITDAAVTTTKLANQAVTTPILADGAVTDVKVLNVAYTKLIGAPASLPPSGTAGGDLTGAYPNPTFSATPSSGTNIINTINASTSNIINASRLPANLTAQGNTFNGNSQLVQLNATGKLPALDGSLLTNVNTSLPVQYIVSSASSVDFSSYTSARTFVIDRQATTIPTSLNVSLPPATSFPAGAQIVLSIVNNNGSTPTTLNLYAIGVTQCITFTGNFNVSTSLTAVGTGLSFGFITNGATWYRIF